MTDISAALSEPISSVPDVGTAIMYALTGAIILISLWRLFSNSILTWTERDAINQRRKCRARDIEQAAARRARDRERAAARRARSQHKPRPEDVTKQG